MIRNFATVSALALGLTAPMAVQAADAPIGLPGDKYESVIDYQPHFYVAARMGANWNHETEFSIPGTTVTNEYDTGLNFSAAIGREFNTAAFGTRAELEIGYQTNEIDSHGVAGVGNFSGGAAFGDTSALYGLVNGYLDFGDIGGALTPYVSAGIGIAHVDFDGHGVAPVGVVMDDSGTGFAWQVGAGVSYDVSERTSLEVGYRFFNVENAGLTSTGGAQSDVDLRSHQVNAGLRYRF